MVTRKHDEIEEGTESVRRTIVGGRPIDRRRRKVRIPIGIEKVLCAAAADPGFRQRLLERRAGALPGTGLEVSEAEAAVLAAVTGDALRTLIENIDLKRHRKRRFFRGIAAASLAATTATACLGENETASAGGMAPDWPEDVVEVVDGTGERGVLADALGGELQDQAGQLDLDSMPPADMGSWSDIPSDEISPPDRPEVQAGVDPGDPDVVEGHDGFAPGGVMPDVIDTETAMDGGMWGDDVNEPK